jgi:hypothetical protein
MAGYSGTPLVTKLGIKPGMSVHLIGAPESYENTLGRLPDNIAQVKTLKAPLDFIQFFTTSRKALEAKFAALAKALAPAGMLWVSWPKKASKVETDVTEDVVRGIALKGGLVDVKVCAVDDIWSGLKLVRRLKDR